jgi:hypothetical protein
MVTWRELDKINVHKVYIMYIFSMTIKSHVCDSWHIIKSKKNEKIILCPPIKSSFLSYGNDFVPKLRVYYAVIVHEFF